ncbi:HDOD domain-containing protein [Maribrevibacterium harenarium]|uniref:HDOD domain-containing protein n=1 Tax=Maribrevibacterium harenarium TaxID=2589817 RepID=A0A501X0Q0_9GAMM|nr:HDOD domain-containing protein [Maribrevibacterium harenarium]TPE53451.1 HDOD domain-containing protein [Maribrevibacterium harenarium]
MAPSEANDIRVRVVHLADNTGKLQVLFPDTAMLDISALSRLTKRRFQPIASYNIEGDPLLKPGTSPSIIDKALAEAESLSLRGNSSQSYKRLSNSELLARFEGPLTRVESVAIPVSQIAGPADDIAEDETQMLNALGKFQSIRLKQRLEETLEIPPLPASSHRIIQLCANPNAGTDELCEVISLDPSLSAQVISWASSPYYGVRDEIDSVEDAIIRVLGFDMVMNLALGLSMGGAFQPPEEGPRHYEDFWFGAVARAVLMESLVKAMPSKQRPRLGHAYLSGLLHNFGYLAIAVVLPPHFSILSRYIEANAHLDSSIIEMHTLHFTKEQLGSWLLRHWNLPESIYTGIRYSKTPTYRGPHQALAHLLYLSGQLMDEGPLDKEILAEVGLSETDAQNCRKRVLASSSELRKMVDLINGNK